MNVSMLRWPCTDDWIRCKVLALNTVGKTAGEYVSEEWKRKILRAEHSPIRTLMFTIKMEIPYYVSTHFVRHKFGVEHYVTSQRNDRQDKYDRRAARQDAEVSHIMDINAAELIAMARKRLCKNADPETQKVMREIVKQVIDLCPEFEGMLVPDCVYRGGCKEFEPCRRADNG